MLCWCEEVGIGIPQAVLVCRGGYWNSTGCAGVKRWVLEFHRLCWCEEVGIGIPQAVLV